MKSPVIVIAAGGTGGHIFPAIATGACIKDIYPNTTVLYACGERPLELDLYKRNGISPKVFPARQLGSGKISKIFNAGAAGLNIIRAAKWLRQVNADVVIGFGGYVAGPTALAGKLVGCKVAIHEANSIAGKTNRILGRIADLSASHFQVTLAGMGGKRKVAVGMPIRNLKPESNIADARRAVGLDPDTETLLVLGGSQGARFLYDKIMDALPVLDALRNRPLQILWSTGEKNYDHLLESRERLSLKNITVVLKPFISDMGNAIKSADVVIGRAGASAMAELLSLRTYAIYVPLPTAIYNHQELNAREAEAAGAGTVILEREFDDNFPSQIEQAFHTVRSCAELSIPENLDSSLAAQRLAKEVMALI